VRLLTVIDTKVVTARLEKAGLKVKAGARGPGRDLPSEDEIKAHGAEVLADVLSELPQALVADISRASPDEGNVLDVQVRVHMDAEAYEQILRRLAKVLAVLRLGKENYDVEIRMTDPGRYRGAVGAFAGTPPPSTKSNPWQLWVMTDTNGFAGKTHWELNHLDVDFTRSVAPLQGRLYALLTALGPDGDLVASDLTPLEPNIIRQDSEPWYRWVSAHVPPKVDRPNQVFLCPAALQVTSLKVNRALDCRVVNVLNRTLSIKGIKTAQVADVACALVYLPD